MTVKHTSEGEKAVETLFQAGAWSQEHICRVPGIGRREAWPH